MDWHIWFEEAKFPDPDGYDSSFKYGEAVYESIRQRVKDKRGTIPSAVFDNTARAYGDLYGYVKLNGTYVLTPDDLKLHAQTPFDDPAPSVVENQIGRLAGYLNRSGWIKVNTDYCSSDSPYSDYEYIHVYQKDESEQRPPVIPEFSTVRDTLEQEYVVSTTGLSSYVGERFSNREEVDDADPKLKEAYTAALETAIDQLNWVAMEATDSDERLWIAPQKSYEELSKHLEGEIEVTDEKLKDELFAFLQRQSPKTESESEFEASPFIRKVEKKLRGENWREVTTDEGKRWYRTEEAHYEALEEYVEEYGETFEDPSDSGKEIIENRKETYEFFKENSYSIGEHGFYNREYLSQQLRRLKFYIEADERFEELDGAETRCGKWTIKYGSELDRENESVAE